MYDRVKFKLLQGYINLRYGSRTAAWFRAHVSYPLWMFAKSARLQIGRLKYMGYRLQSRIEYWWYIGKCRKCAAFEDMIGDKDVDIILSLSGVEPRHGLICHSCSRNPLHYDYYKPAKKEKP